MHGSGTKTHPSMKTNFSSVLTVEVALRCLMIIIFTLVVNYYPRVNNQPATNRVFQLRCSGSRLCVPLVIKCQVLDL